MRSDIVDALGIEQVVLTENPLVVESLLPRATLSCREVLFREATRRELWMLSLNYTHKQRIDKSTHQPCL